MVLQGIKTTQMNRPFQPLNRLGFRKQRFIIDYFERRKQSDS